MTKKDKDSITISKRALWAAAPIAAITGILLSRHDPGALVLFFLGIGLGVYLGRVTAK